MIIYGSRNNWLKAQ